MPADVNMQQNIDDISFIKAIEATKLIILKWISNIFGLEKTPFVHKLQSRRPAI